MRRELDLALKANKRMLTLLDMAIAEAGEVDGNLLLDDLDDQSLPFSYVTLDGVDQLPGVNMIGQAAANGDQMGITQPFYGFVRTDADSAFVLGSIFCAVLYNRTSFGVETAKPLYWDAPSAEAFNTIAMRLYDETNARWINLSYDETQTPTQNVGLPISMFGQLFASSQGGLKLPAECVFPRNATIRVEAAFTVDPAGVSATAKQTRVAVIFHGHKVFGG